ncbi:MAG TPA: hypothetical protein VGL71_09700 [Urbifossiella sp.]
MRRFFVGMLILTGLSVLSWVRADNPSGQTCCDPICAVDDESCTGENHDKALLRYRTNQSRHWRHLMIGSH